MVPGLGDDIQNMKAGLMEIADIFVLNKSDREGADRLEQQLHAMLQLAPEREGWRPPVVRTVATENKGIDALAKAIAEFRERFATSKQRREKKIEHWKQRLMEMLETRLLERALDGAAGEKLLGELAESVANRRTDPFSAVSEILRQSGLG
jgi:LAO/AO transport system kinase